MEGSELRADVPLRHKAIESATRTMRELHLYPDFWRITGSPAGPIVCVNGEEKIVFGGNNYLGLSHHPSVVAAVVEAVQRYGYGATGSPLATGYHELLWGLEERLARFKGTEACLVGAAGFQVNSETIQTVSRRMTAGGLRFDGLKSECILFADYLNHASIHAGMQGVRELKLYRHGDMNHLESLLSDYRNSPRPLIIITDSVFSMQGALAPLPEVLDLARRFGAAVYLDEAHATGVFGDNGRGALEHFGLEASEDKRHFIQMGTMSKAIGGQGGFICGTRDFCDALRVTCNGYIFSAGLSPAVCAGALAAIDIIEGSEGKELRRELAAKSSYLRENLARRGFNTLDSKTQIIPIFIGNEEKCHSLSRSLLERGLLVPAIRFPAVPREESMLRASIMATHTYEQLDRLVEELSLLADRVV